MKDRGAREHLAEPAPPRAANKRAQAVGRPALGDVIDAHAEAGSLLGREIDPIELEVLAHVTDEVRQLERRAELGHGGVQFRRDAQQRRHDQSDGAGAAAHVLLELGASGHPHRTAVQPHRVHVHRQLGQRQVVPAPGVDQRRDHRMPRGPGGDTALELGLPAIQRLAGAQPDRARDRPRRPTDRHRARIRTARAQQDALPGEGATWPSNRSDRVGAASAGRLGRPTAQNDQRRHPSPAS